VNPQKEASQLAGIVSDEFQVTTTRLKLVCGKVHDEPAKAISGRAAAKGEVAVRINVDLSLMSSVQTLMKNIGLHTISPLT
jgi:hypothetical protein